MCHGERAVRAVGAAGACPREDAAASVGLRGERTGGVDGLRLILFFASRGGGGGAGERARGDSFEGGVRRRPRREGREQA